MHEYDRGQGITVDTVEVVFLFLCGVKDLYNQEKVQRDEHCRAGKTPLFSNCAKDEVGALFRYKVEFGLRAFQEPFAHETSGPNGNL